MKLWKKILLGLVLGLLFGTMAPQDWVAWVTPIGELFIRAVKMLIAPLILATLISGVTSMKDSTQMGRVGLKTLGIYIFTTTVAVSIGLLLASHINLAGDLKLSLPDIASSKTLQTDLSIVGIIPENPFQSLVEGNVLQIITFAILLGISMNLIGKKAAPVVSFFESFAEVMFKLTMLIMETAPFGVFALMAGVASEYGLDVLLPLSKVILTVYVGCVLHALVTFGGGLFFVKLNPKRFFKDITDAQVVAFTTASSAATLPITIGCARKNLGVSDRISSFVLSLGSTINMDGTALYQGIVTVFIAQAYGVTLSPEDYGIIVITSTLASIGAASVPSAGLFMLTLVLGSVGLPLEAIAMIAGIDRILDMARTTVNVTGDCFVSTLIAKSEGELNEKSYNAEPVI